MMGPQAVRLLEELGYTHVSHFGGGVQAWQDAGLRVEHGPGVREPAPLPRHPIRIRRDRWGAFVDLFERRTTADLVWLWLATAVGCALIYWLLARAGIGSLRESDEYIAGGSRGFLTALYFSFGVATSAALGDVVPMGALRPLAVVEAAAGLLLFGALVSKILSRRQEQVVTEIHRLAYEDRLERVQSDLHLVLTELQRIAQMCRAPEVPEEQIKARVDSASGMCLAELRAIHGLLYRPEEVPGEAMLEGILASLAGVMRELRDLVRCLSSRSAYLSRNIEGLTRLAEEICADCVPRRYAPTMREWMDTIQAVARELR
ncbi:MAG TPA: ion channel [Vicinamibacterales bacterium]|nr:ion channel [Vicinamibacterales bacterium]